MLKIYHGIKFPIGIVTTYNEWMIVWLAESNALATCDNEEEISRLESDVSADVTRMLEGKEVMHCSRIYQRHEVALVEVLASVMVKMVKSPRLTRLRALGQYHNSSNDDTRRRFGKISRISSSSGDDKDVFTLEALPMTGTGTGSGFGIRYG
jgi:hypothetical protein